MYVNFFREIMVEFIRMPGAVAKFIFLYPDTHYVRSMFVEVIGVELNKHLQIT